MSVKVTIKLYKTKIAKLNEASLKAHEMAANAVLSDIKTSQVVPHDTGTLEDSGFVDTTGINRGMIRIIFDTPYARRLYWHPEYNFRTDKNPNARGKWMSAYEKGGEKEDFFANAYKAFMKMNSGGIIK